MLEVKVIYFNFKHKLNYIHLKRTNREANYHPGRIFTYVDSDPYEFYEEINAEVNKAPKSVIPSYLERNDVQMRRRKPLLEKSKQNESRVARMNIVNYKPHPDESRRYQSKIIPFHTMYIMADLSNEKQFVLILFTN